MLLVIVVLALVTGCGNEKAPSSAQSQSQTPDASLFNPAVDACSRSEETSLDSIGVVDDARI